MKSRMHSSRMRTARLLTTSHSARGWMGGGCSAHTPWMQNPPDADPLLLEADRRDPDPLVMSPVMHAGKPTPHRVHKQCAHPRFASGAFRNSLANLRGDWGHLSIIFIPGSATGITFFKVARMYSSRMHIARFSSHLYHWGGAAALPLGGVCLLIGSGG